MAEGAMGRPDAEGMREDWNAYWADKQHVRVERSTYDVFAKFYRNRLIRPTLNRVMAETYSGGVALLHAGCGGGEVDADLVKRYRITALDISPRAIGLYQSRYPGTETLIGDIFALRSLGRTFDGVYNLGVMEHFSEEQIVMILKEINACLAKGGKAVIFWPPVYGLSVIALHGIHFVLNTILRRNVALHPAEPTKVSSKDQVSRLLSEAGFRLERMRFGPSDAFTYVIVTAVKL
jgi:SAM-dependent methyltransferase